MQSAVMFSPLLQLVFLLSFIQLSPVVFTVMWRVNKQEDLTGWYTFFWLFCIVHEILHFCGLELGVTRFRCKFSKWLH